MKNLTVLLLLLAGCAALPKRTDYDQGKDQEQFERDYAACEMKVAEFPADSTWKFNGNVKPWMDKCLRSKGYKTK